jgi:hypothetical protein
LNTLPIWELPARRIARKSNARQREYLDIPIVASEGAILVSSAAKPVLAPSPLNLLLLGNKEESFSRHSGESKKERRVVLR